MVIFGGAPGTSTAFNDLWSYRPTTNTWTQLQPTGAGPSPRSRHSVVWDAASRQMLVFGGYATAENTTGNYTNELWSYNVATNAWAKLTASGAGPSARARHSATWDPDNAQMLIFGGYVGGVDYLADLWSYKPSTNQWTRRDGDGVEPRSRGDHSAVWDPTGDGLLLYGGTGGDLTSELWSYRPPSGPKPVLAPARGV
jgi:N-acetylneuraminic acid mutarotase